MGIRLPARAGAFYPDQAGACLHELGAGSPAPPAVAAGEVCLGGIVPHAGWAYSGPTALRTWRWLAACQPPPGRILLLGAVHVPGVRTPSVGSWEQWASPLGLCPVDQDFSRRLVQAGLVREHDAAHRQEHAIEVSVPMIQHLLPGVPIVPVAVPAQDAACGFGRALAAVVRGDAVVTHVVASTDLTHYGAHYYDFAPAGVGSEALRWAQANDQRLLQRIAALDAEAIVGEARTHHNACGAGALAAAVACARELGATRAQVLEHTTSHGQQPAATAADFVGYVSAVFLR